MECSCKYIYEVSTALLDYLHEKYEEHYEFDDLYWIEGTKISTFTINGWTIKVGGINDQKNWYHTDNELKLILLSKKTSEKNWEKLTKQIDDLAKKQKDNELKFILLPKKITEENREKLKNQIDYLAKKLKKEEEEKKEKK